MDTEHEQNDAEAGVKLGLFADAEADLNGNLAAYNSVTRAQGNSGPEGTDAPGVPSAAFSPVPTKTHDIAEQRGEGTSFANTGMALPATSTVAAAGYVTEPAGHLPGTGSVEVAPGNAAPGLIANDVGGPRDPTPGPGPESISVADLAVRAGA